MKSKRPDIRGDLFGMKWKMRIGFWNVRTMREYGKLKQVEEEMTSYKLDIMGVSETRWKENGETKTQNRNFLIFSGVGEGIERAQKWSEHHNEQRSPKKLNGTVTNFGKDNISRI